eukprot:5496737-Alexandrium_andersonii.AAC.1
MCIRDSTKSPACGGGVMQPFDAEQFDLAMQSEGRYMCGANMLWANPFFSAQSGVPLNPKSID